MLGEDEFNLLQSKITSYYGEGQSTFQDELLNQYMYNVENYPKMEQILRIPTANEYTTHFALKSITKCIDTLFASWTPEEFRRISENYLLLLFHEINRFYSSLNLVLPCYCKMYATIARYGWHVMNTECSNYLDFITNIERFFGSTSQHYIAGLLLYKGIIEKMTDLKDLESTQVFLFKDHTLLIFLQKAFTTLDEIENRKILERFDESESMDIRCYALDLLVTIFSFLHREIIATDNNSTSSENKKFTTLPVSWQGKIDLKHLIQLIYSSYSTLNENCINLSLDNLYYLAACKRRSFAKGMNPNSFDGEEGHRGGIYDHEFYDCLLTAITSIINEQSETLQESTNLQKVCEIVSRLRKSLDTKIVVQISSFPTFIECIAALTNGVFSIDFISNPDNLQIIENLMNFWCDMISIANGKKDQELLDLIKTIFDRYLELLEEFMATLPSDAYDALFPEFSELYPLVKIVRKMTDIDSKTADLDQQTYQKELLDRFVDARDKYYDNFDSDDDIQPLENRFCLYTLALASFVSDVLIVNKSGYANQFIIDGTALLLSLIRTSDEIILQRQNGRIVHEYCIMLVIKMLKNSMITKEKTPFDDIPAFSTENNIHCLQDVLAIIFPRIIHSIYFFPNEQFVILSALDALEPYIILSEDDPSKESKKDAISKVLVADLLQFDPSMLEFTQNPDNRESTIHFFSLIAQLMIPHIGIDEESSEIYSDDMSPKFTGLVSSMKERIEQLDQAPEVQELMQMLLYLTGLFKGCVYNYPRIVDYFFPDTVHHIIHASQQNQELFLPLAEFLYNFVFNKNSRQQYLSAHSATGLLIFKETAEALVFYFQIQIDLSESPNLIEYLYKILNTILSNESSNIGAIEVYEDPALNNLLSAFFTFSEHFSVDYYNQYSFQLVVPVLELTKTLFTDFSDYIIDIKPSFIPFALELSLSIADNVHDVDLNEVTSTLQSISLFSVKYKNEPEFAQYLTQMMPIFEKLLVIYERFLLLKTSDTDRKAIINLFEIVIQLEPQNWPVVRTRLRLFFNDFKFNDQKEELKRILTIPEDFEEEQTEQ